MPSNHNFLDWLKPCSRPSQKDGRVIRSLTLDEVISETQFISNYGSRKYITGGAGTERGISTWEMMIRVESCK
jgi:hypothetical protein